MTTLRSNPKRNTVNIIGTVLCWFAVIGQLVLIIINRQADIFETVIRFFSFFTILTNILVALYFTSQIFNHKILKFLKNNSALTAITSFILTVGLVYQLVLRSIWQPAGFQMVIDELLHTIVPIYVLLYWFLNINLHNLKPQNLIVWLLYPFIYFIFVMIRGYFSGFYPYPFIDVSNIGYLKVLGNFTILSIFMMMVLGVLYLLSRFLIKK